jgi:RNA polymerase sigma factor (sigma-70 family)
MRGGDAAAREALARRYLPILKRLAHGRLPHRARGLIDTDDLVQLTLVSALTHLDGFEPRRQGAFHAYLRQILVNKIRDEARRAQRSPEHEPLGDGLSAGERSPLEESIGRDRLEAYEQALLGLNEQQREAVVMRVEMGFTYQEIAEQIGSPSSNAARMLIGRALVQMAKEMRAQRE